MAYANLIIEPGTAGIVTVTINRPKVLNALDAATLGELEDVFGGLGEDPALRCVILTGAGEKAFVAGADISAMASLGPRQARAFAERGQGLAAAIETLPVPVIAAVNGFALGGGLELLLACDFALASTAAKLGLPEVSLGVIPGFGGTQRLTRRIGIGRARELIYTGNTVTAEEALRLGLVNAVTEPAGLLPAARVLAEKIASRAPLAIVEAKRAIRDGADLPLPAALTLERELFAGLFATDDQKEGMRAFLEKRPAAWQGR